MRESHGQNKGDSYNALPYSSSSDEFEDYDDVDEEETSENESEVRGRPVDDFSDMLSEATRRRLIGKGITSLFPVQIETLQRVMRGENIVVRSRTGSGKTLGFAIPIIEMLDRDSAQRPELTRAYTKAAQGVAAPPGPRCLVLAPTRELAGQVADEFKRVAGRLRVCAIYGGTAFGPQLDALREGVDIVVGTPGRVMDMMQSGSLRLNNVRVVVLDEADEMLRMGFKEDVETILADTPEEKQAMLWSATVPPWVRSLAGRFLRSPVFVDLVGDDAAKLPKTVAQVAHVVHESTRDESLAAVLSAHCNGVKEAGGVPRVLVFTETKLEAGRLAALQVPGVRLSALTGDMAQAARERTLTSLRNGAIDVVVATDVAARGLDLNDVTAVVQYRLPRGLETFVHRSGRTGRAGKQGVTITLAAATEHRLLVKLEKDLGFQFALNPIPLPGMAENGSLSAKHSDRLLRSILNVPSVATESIVNSGVFDAIVGRVGAESGLKAALALLATGATNLTYKSLQSGASNVVTVQIDTESEEFKLLTGATVPRTSDSIGPQIAAFAKQSAPALKRLFAAGNVSPGDRPSLAPSYLSVPSALGQDLGNIHYTPEGVFLDLPVAVFDEFRATLAAKLEALAASKPVPTKYQVSSVVAPAAALPASVRSILSKSSEQYSDLEAPHDRNRSLKSKGRGDRGGDRFRGDRGGDRFRDKDRDRDRNRDRSRDRSRGGGKKEFDRGFDARGSSRSRGRDEQDFPGTKSWNKSADWDDFFSSGFESSGKRKYKY